MLATQPTCDIGVERAATATVVTVTGEIDLFGAPALAEALDRAAEWPDPVVVDLSPCTFFDSNGLHALLRAERDGRRVVVCGPPSGCAARLFDITVPGRFPPHGTRDQALAVL